MCVFSQGPDTASDELVVTLRDLWITPAGIVVLLTALNPTQSGTAVVALGKIDTTSTGSRSGCGV